MNDKNLILIRKAIEAQLTDTKPIFVDSSNAFDWSTYGRVGDSVTCLVSGQMSATATDIEIEEGTNVSLLASKTFVEGTVIWGKIKKWTVQSGLFVVNMSK